MPIKLPKILQDEWFEWFFKDILDEIEEDFNEYQDENKISYDESTESVMMKMVRDAFGKVEKKYMTQPFAAEGYKEDLRKYLMENVLESLKFIDWLDFQMGKRKQRKM